MKNGIKILSHEKQQASVQMLLSPASFLHVRAPQVVSGDDAQTLSASQDARQAIRSQLPTLEAPKFETLEDLQPQESDYIYPLFRALSKTVIPGYWLDYTQGDVLKDSLQLLNGQTVYKNHNFCDIEGWLGAVNEVTWDEAGEASGGVSGINAELKLDWKVAPKIARGLLMTPPAIHSVSVTVVFEFDFSHPELAEQRRFWDLMGEEVDGQIVRLIVTKILAYYEISLVFQGADSLAKKRASDKPTGVNSQSAYDETSSTDVIIATPHTTKELTVNLTPEQKAALGLQSHASEDVPESLVVPAIDRLAAQAQQGAQLLDTARAECLRVATLAVVGAGEGKAPDALAEVINGANPTQLQALTKMYAEQAASKFPHTCQSCGSKSQAARSSIEDVAEEASTQQAAPLPTRANSMH